MAEANAGSPFPEPTNNIVANGRISPDLSRLLHQKRKSLHLSLRKLSRILGISWSTLHKWETGQINTCRPHHRDILTSFVCDNLNAHLSPANSSPATLDVNPDQTILLFVQTQNSRAMIALPTSSSTACTNAFQTVINYINDQIQALQNTTQQPPAHSTPEAGQGTSTSRADSLLPRTTALHGSQPTQPDDKVLPPPAKHKPLTRSPHKTPPTSPNCNTLLPPPTKHKPLTRSTRQTPVHQS